MATEYFTLSNFGVRYFLKDYTDSDTVPAAAGPSDELDSVLSADIGSFSKDVKAYKPLNGNGWDIIASLGQSQDDASFDLVRTGTGDAYVGTAGSSTYTKLRKWFMDAAAQGGNNSPKCIVEVVPRGGSTPAYEGTCFYVVPKNWGPGAKDTDTGQEYSITVSPFGPPQPVTVTHTPAAGSTPESWAFAKPSST